MSRISDDVRHIQHKRIRAKFPTRPRPGRIFKRDRSLDARLLFTLEAIRSLYVSLNEQIASALNALSVAQLTTDQRLEKAGNIFRRKNLLPY